MINKCEDIESFLKGQGMISVSGGAQIDLNIAQRNLGGGKWQDVHSCDHDCRGVYDCPAAISVNRGVDRSKQIPLGVLVRSVENIASGLFSANKRLVHSGLFSQYCAAFHIPPDVAVVYRNNLMKRSFEVNFFGNPEMYEQLSQAISLMNDRGYVVNVTTTGRKIMRDLEFRRAFKLAGPRVLAMSYDFSSPEEVRRFGSMESDEILTEMRDRIKFRREKFSGQRFKVYESAFVAKLAEEEGGFPQVVFNLVLHSGNMEKGKEVVHALMESFTGVKVNPYPAQFAFYGERSNYSEGDVRSFSEFVDFALREHLDLNRNSLVRRLQYWLMMKAVIEVSGGNSSDIAERIGGRELWDCYSSPGSGRYVQAGGSFEVREQRRIEQDLHLNCYWNSGTINCDNIPVHEMPPKEVSNYILTGARRIAVLRESPCVGCAMPRLNFDELSLVAGIRDEAVRNMYLGLRKKVVGF